MSLERFEGLQGIPWGIQYESDCRGVKAAVHMMCQQRVPILWSAFPSADLRSTPNLLYCTIVQKTTVTAVSSSRYSSTNGRHLFKPVNQAVDRGGARFHTLGSNFTRSLSLLGERFPASGVGIPGKTLFDSSNAGAHTRRFAHTPFHSSCPHVPTFFLIATFWASSSRNL